MRLLGMRAVLLLVVGLTSRQAIARTERLEVPTDAHPLEMVEVAPEDEPRIFDGVLPRYDAPIHRQSILPDHKSIRILMSPVKDQGQRGTCNVFAAIALLEAAREEFYSEQCLARDSSGADAGHVRQRLDFGTDVGVNLEKDCPYFLQRDVMPDASWRSQRRHVLGGRVYGRHFSNGSNEDPVQFVKDMLNQALPVAVGVVVAGRWWNDRVHIPACLHDSALEAERASRSDEQFCWGPTFAADHAPDDRERRQLALTFEAYKSSAAWHRDFSTDPKGKWIKHSFAQWLQLMRPLDVPPDEEISASCGKRANIVGSKN